ncbi:hypothetical protein [Vallitalea okinawensis]|nr:hypothetical protein [Vallitalea okinawensis]
MNELDCCLYGVGYIGVRRDEIEEELKGRKYGKSVKLRKPKRK